MVDTTFAPYYDDYDETKGFHKILFKPRVGVQVRELNQLQTMMQKQIERFGSHIFENGSMVVPGESNYDYAYEYVTLSNIDYETVAEILQTNTVTLVGGTTGVVATIVQHVANNTSDPVTVYVKYESSGTGGESRFADAETVTLTYGTTDFTQATVLTTGQGSVFTIEAGIFYFNGDFIRTDAQRAVLGKYTNKPSAVVGFRLTESIVTWTEDASLVDVGNKNAIGADRLKKVLTLEVRGLDEVFDRETFIELAQFEEGVYRKKVLNSTYSVLADTMARRTYDESGDYTVTPFNVRLREHMKDGNNEGLYDAPKGIESKFAVGVEPGKAYVRGYEVENFATRYIDVNKARETGRINNSSFTLSVGNYITVSSLNVLPKSNTFQQITFYSGVPSAAGAIPAGTVLGTARVRYTEMSSVTGQAFLFLFDVKSAAGTNDTSFIDNAKSVYSAGTVAMTALVQSELIDSVNHGLVFKMPVNNVKTLLTAGASDTSFSVIRQFSAVADSAGVVILSAGTNESFATPTPANACASYTITGGSITKRISTLASLGGVPVGSTMTINLGIEAAGLTVTINVEVIKQQAIQKAKTKTIAPALTKTPAQVVNRRVPLDKADVYKITSITENGVDKTSKYKLNRNITPEYYGVSYLELNTGEAVPTANLVINFEYLLHGAGDYFNVDSYSSVAYKDIPTEVINSVTVSMADVVDFRPRINDAGTGFTGTGASVIEVPAQYALMRCDIDHYLPRVDKVYVDSKGNFGVIEGVPAVTPTEPATPDNTMVLYKLVVPAYTRNVADIQAIFINNRRYTMRDIGMLEDRIANVEYYTTLSLLENETNAMQIVDATTGLARFKNGFITDSFIDYSVAAGTSADFKCSISDNVMRPGLGVDFVDLKLDANYSSGVQQTGPLITLPYTERVFLSQMLASDTMNVNPYAVYRWNGTLTLNPSNDVWFDSLIVGTSSVGSTVGSWTDTSVSTAFTTFLNGNASTSNDPNSHLNAHDQQGQAATSTTTSVVTTSSYVVTTQVGTSDIPFMRAREVEFTGKGMMPYSRAYAYFDDVDVSSYCRTGTQAYGTPMFVDANGAITGTFNIPNTEALRFRTGTKQFTLIDDPDNVRELALSYAGAKYTAKGTLNLFEQTVVTTTVITQVTDTDVVPWDPLAQSFFVESPSGVFVTSIELYFKTKDKAMPVSIQIRDMDNGFPGKNIVPYSTATLNPDEVNVSNNGTLSTKFKLDAPVYLANGNEYCFVVMSNSNNYNAFIATMGQVSLTENVAIAKQPFIGVMFKSQNNSTWSEDQASDMKFRINTAKFQTDVVGDAGMVMGTPALSKLTANPLTSVSGSNVIKAFIPNHGFFVGTKFGIGQVDIAPGIPLTEMNVVQTAFEVIDPDYVTFKVTTAANATGTFGGANVMTEKCMAISYLQPIIQTLLFNQTNAAWRYRGTTGKSVDGSETPYLQAQELNITPGANNLLTSPHVIPNLSDAADKLTAPAGIITASLVTFVDTISPVIDLNRCGVIGFVNRVNNPAVLNETAATGGNAYARYITKVVGLKNAANSLKMYIDANQPQDAVVQVLYRTGNTEQEVNDKVWSVMDAVSTGTTTDPFVFKEFEYNKDGIPLFSFYQYKVVTTSTSSCKVPLFKRLRGIALGT